MLDAWESLKKVSAIATGDTWQLLHNIETNATVVNESLEGTITEVEILNGVIIETELLTGTISCKC